MENPVISPALLIKKKPSTTLLGYPFIICYIFMGGIGIFIDSSFGTATVVFLAVTVLIHILLYLNTEWSFTFNTKINFEPTNSIEKATHAHCQFKSERSICPIIREDTIYIYFNFKKYCYDDEKHAFCPLIYPDTNPLSTYTNANWLTIKQSKEHEKYYGLNKCNIPIPTFMDLYKEQIIAPFFVFQIVCSILWMLDEFPIYAFMMLVMLFLFEAITTFTRLRNYGNFKAMASMKPTNHTVIRDGNEIEVDCEHIFPGDLLKVTSGKAIADGVIVKGMCVVNEAMLTGESTPHMRESITTIIDDNNQMDALDFETHKHHIIFGGTDVLQDENCLLYVCHTGFHTAQGNLLRTIISSSERKTANNLESFVVILFLLVFALIASGYVFYDGVLNGKDMWKLILSCVLIITNVVPPELPLELTNAINYSLMSLKKQFIYCTEPFRIPFAGAVDICAFDKTGTLTSDEVSVAGVAGISDDPFKLFTSTQNIPNNIIHILAGCNSLSKLKDGNIIGDPAEKAAIDFVNWKIVGDGSFVPNKKSNYQISTIQRFPFSSLLKRMSAVITLHDYHLNNKTLLAVVKGAPEILKSRFIDTPHNYDNICRFFTLQGMRVFAFGSKDVKKSSNGKYIRDEIETDLHFGGFVMFSSPLKEKSAETVELLQQSEHNVVMITGDNIFTATHVAKELNIVKGETLQLILNSNNDYVWVDMEGIEMANYEHNNVNEIITKSSLCLSGDAFQHIIETAQTNVVKAVLASTKVYARVTPQQKEKIITLLKKYDHVVLMCGDGTNDVGALKQADVGVAVLNTTPSEREQKEADAIKLGIVPLPSKPKPKPLSPEEIQRRRNMTPQERQEFMKQQLKKALEGLPEDESSVAKFGDASMASPFSCKSIEITPICNVLKQGRCTLVTTQQMFRILALNCLVSAYDLSVLKLEGVKNGDLQMTVSGILLSVCFLMLSNTQPLDKLNKSHPTKSIFAPFHVCSVLSQALIHFVIIQFALKTGKDALGDTYKKPDPDAEFTPSLVNTIIFLISNTINVTTFAVNYVGEPYRKNITEYKPLMYCLLAVFGLTVVFAFEIIPELNQTFQLVPFPTQQLKFTIILLITLDVVLSFVVERSLRFFLKFNR
ncbi:P5A-ATPase transmembrane helical hairpin domain-containing protein [Entamoeba marina]